MILVSRLHLFRHYRKQQDEAALSLHTSLFLWAICKSSNYETHRAYPVHVSVTRCPSDLARKQFQSQHSLPLDMSEHWKSTVSMIVAITRGIGTDLVLAKVLVQTL